MPQKLKQKIVLAIFLFLVTMATGVIGYQLLSPSATFLDALYMTVITLATVGYGEIIDLTHNPTGRIFTMVLIMFGMGNILFVATTITEIITNGEIQEMLIRRRMQKMIDKIKNHIILCGGGIISKKIIEELLKTSTPFVFVSNNHSEILEMTQLYKDILYIENDPSHNGTLISAGIEGANGLITALPDDRDNLFVVVTAKKLKPTLRIIAGANNPEHIEKYKSVGVESTISPNLIGGLRMVSEMIRPNVVTFLDIMMRDTSDNNRFTEVTISPTSTLVSQTIGNSKIRDKTGLLVLSIKQPTSDNFVYNPLPSEMLLSGTVLIVIGSTEKVAQLIKLAN